MVFFFFIFIYNIHGDYVRKKVYIFSFIFFIIDLLSKILVTNIDINMPYKIINNFFYIDLITNTGAAFSILSGSCFLFIIIAIGILFYIDRFIVTDVNHFLYLSLIIGGIIGNLFDRVAYGKVIDFLSFRFGSYYFPIFNLADTFICVGVFLLITDYIRSDKNGNKSR